jgi:hypothetical protein
LLYLLSTFIHILLTKINEYPIPYQATEIIFSVNLFSFSFHILLNALYT